MLHNLCSITDGESHDNDFFTRFARNPILEILIKNIDCVGCTIMRGLKGVRYDLNDGFSSKTTFYNMRD